METALVLAGLTLAVLSSSVAGEIAVDRRRSATMWMAWGLVFPVIGPLLVALLPTRPAKSQPQ